jgi:5-formyltetrahydrofolate cyclo-ligase
MELAISKDIIRKGMKEKRMAMTLAEVMEKSHVILEQFFKTPAYLESDTIFTYVSVKNEVDTTPLIQQAIKDHKQIAVPKVTGKRTLTFYYITSFEDLEPAKFNLLEPKENCELAIKSPEIIVIPGLAFDKNKNRLGYGGGFYDSYLAQHQGGQKVGLTYDFQIIEEVPVNDHDILLDMVISEKIVI